MENSDEDLDEQSPLSLLCSSILWRILEPRWALGVMNCVHTWNFGFLEPPTAHGTRGQCQCHVAPEQGDGLSLLGTVWSIPAPALVALRAVTWKLSAECEVHL